MVTRSDLHRLIDELREGELAPAASYLQRLHDDPFLAALEAAPLDDEPVTPEDIEAIERGREEHRRGETIPWEVVKREILGE